ncbi:Uncharacterized protein TCM_042589 [Theobroma cacao]|uniref:Uncharacterized protein n=1 Tax=Theobroma cacao TaxID=3641 RepID=A0A061FLU2_THECC|nr:Uncharacterized protein TCM_042589 [Theobroma cacao]
MEQSVEGCRPLWLVLFEEKLLLEGVRSRTKICRPLFSLGTVPDELGRLKNVRILHNQFTSFSELFCMMSWEDWKLSQAI